MTQSVLIWEREIIPTQFQLKKTLRKLMISTIRKIQLCIGQPVVQPLELIGWTELTHQQLSDWGAKCHEIKMWKPNYDLFICDKAINTAVFFNKGNKNETI